MIQINLLPPAERRPKWPLSRMFAAAGMVVVFVCVCLYGYSWYQIRELEVAIAQTRNQLELLRPLQAKMIDAQTKQQRLDAKNNILVALTRERQSWYALVARLGIVTPPQVWLTEVAAAENGAVRLKGMAAAYPDLAAYVKKLEQDDIFAEPVLVKAERDGARTVTRFELTVKVKGL
ncbi:Fimbrial assembly family protein [Thermosinus carboxydivorans Nor1]|uniref:Fimbrial assembly family protein n=1 Tax=Thermosinus carboxydivorans Nor1 TaxID=401526 RepID=A1HQ13_9FIRM|nr:PilN domain-containing protein [Thermosinus carboxydivorans]EAX47864.1 Fimbrial assembly family protein [Thermosinus carboxydivorans Nor1]